MKIFTRQFLLIYLMLCTQLAWAETSPPKRQLIFVDFGVVSNPLYRGLVLDNSSSKVSLEYSMQGFSAGYEIDIIDSNDDLTVGFLSYSYSTEPLIASVGFNFISSPAYTRSKEYFFEIVGRQNFLNFRPSIFLTKEFDGDSREYIELRVEKYYEKESWIFSPFIEVGYGSYYNESITNTHSRVGFDVAKWIGQRSKFSINLSVNRPGSSMENIDDSPETSFSGGVLMSWFF